MVIIGLGNPGKEYENTHHNVGFMFVDKVIDSLNINFKLDKKHQAYVAVANINNEKHYFLKPITYMNLSGKAVKSFLDYYKISEKEILVVSDDLDLPLSTIRIRKNGSAGGHNGIKSIINELGTSEFARLRIGIGRLNNKNVIDYVLSNFSSNEKETLSKTLEIAPNIFLDLVNNNLDYIMNKYNGMKN